MPNTPQESPSRKYDIIVFGASGFTGAFIAAELIKKKKNVPVALAGRNAEKVCKAVTSRGVEMKNVPKILEADVKDKNSLNELARSTKLLLNCVGPYYCHGEPVVKACVENGTHYMDICGEPLFIETMQLKYDEEAKKNKCTVVSACAFDSVPCDLGMTFATKMLEAGVPHKVESFLQCNGGPSGLTFHATTFECIILGISNIKELVKIRQRRTAAGQRPRDKFKGPKVTFPQCSVFKDPRMPDVLCTTFLGSDRSVVQRTKELIALEDKSYVPPQHQCYLTVRKGLVSKLKLNFFLPFLNFLCGKKWGRKLLQTFPGFFTLGMFTHAGPSERQLAETTYRFDIFAEGYSSERRLTESPDERDVRFRCSVTGPEPGYVATSRIFVIVALHFLQLQNSQIKHGVLTTGKLFRNDVDLLKKLSDDGCAVFENIF